MQGAHTEAWAEGECLHQNTANILAEASWWESMHGELVISPPYDQQLHRGIPE